jgi:hypothetical protein
VVKLFGFNYDEGCNLNNGLVERCELLRGVLRRRKGFKSTIQQGNEPLLENHRNFRLRTDAFSF